MTGVVNSVSSCETSRPPTMAMPSGRRSSRAGAEAERERQRAEQRGQRGHHDRAEAQQAGLVDRLLGSRPSSRSASSAKSIIMIAFFFTMPMSRMMPMSAMMLKLGARTASSASSAPTPADGSVERIVIGWMQLS